MMPYADSPLPLPDFLSERHADEIRSFSEPGTWGSGTQRAYVARIARGARCRAGLQEADAAHERGADREPGLSGQAREVIEQIAVAPKELDRAFLDAALDAGISDAEYVEIVGIVARIVNLDVFARGIGVPSRQLEQPHGGEPSRTRPSTAIVEGAWLPTIPWGPDGGAEGRGLYGAEWQPFIYRALSLVPDEARRCMKLGDEQYLPGERFMQFDYSSRAGLTRPQMEVVAGRTSAINECFY